MNVLTEKKDHIIKKIPNLTPEQQTEVINYFTKHPDAESEIDWNKWEELTYSSFEPLLKRITKTARKKAVRDTGIAGLIEYTDYEVAYQEGNVIGYCPLNWEASKLIASRSIGGTEGKWCTAYGKDRTYWDDHIGDKEEFLIYFIDFTEDNVWKKTALVASIHTIGWCEFWDRNDNRFIVNKAIISKDLNYLPYPQLFLDADRTEDVINKARKKVLGKLEANRREEHSEIAVNIYSKNKKDNSTFVKIEYSLVTYRGEEATGSSGPYNDTTSEFTIHSIGKDTEYSELEHLEQFNIYNGNGIFIDCEEYTPAEAIENAKDRLGDDNVILPEHDYDTTVQYLSNTIENDGHSLKKLDYLISNNDLILDDFYLRKLLINCFLFTIDKNGSFTRNYQPIHVKIRLDLDYTIYYRLGYNYTQREDWVTNATQRNIDRQLDLPFKLNTGKIG